MSEFVVERKSQWLHGRLYCLPDSLFELPPHAANGGILGAGAEVHIPEQEYMTFPLGVLF